MIDRESNNSTNPAVLSKKVLLPFSIVTALFALWGFANAVTDPMVQAFKKVLELSNTDAAWVQMAFYGGYFCMALPAALFVRKFSYKSGIILGLALYAVGALMFFPAAVSEKFWFFCLGLYILTFGLAFLETTANPYILSMGHPKTATRRLNLAQAFNPIGSILGLLVAQKFVLSRLQSDDIADFSALDAAQKALIRASDLMVIRNPYVVLGLVILAFLALVVFIKMPSGSDDTDGSETLGSIFSSLTKRRRYVFGVIAQVFYVGAQIMCWTYIYQYAEAKGIDSAAAANYQFVAFVLFFVGRAIGTYMLRFVPAFRLLLMFGVCACLMTVGTIFMQGIIGLYALVLVSFFMSVMFPTIYGLALEGLSEEHTKIGAAGLVMAIVGGALMPFLQGMIVDFGGSAVDDMRILGVPEVNFSFVLPLICFAVVMTYGYTSRSSSVSS